MKTFSQAGFISCVCYLGLTGCAHTPLSGQLNNSSHVADTPPLTQRINPDCQEMIEIVERIGEDKVGPDLKDVWVRWKFMSPYGENDNFIRPRRSHQMADTHCLPNATLLEPIGVKWDGWPLALVFYWITAETGVEVSVDWRSMATIGVHYDTPVHMTMEGLGQEVLESVLKQVGEGRGVIDYQIAHNSVRVFAAAN